MEFMFTTEQMDTVCEWFGVKREELEEWQIAELLDKLINYTTTNFEFQGVL